MVSALTGELAVAVSSYDLPSTRFESAGPDSVQVITVRSSMARVTDPAAALPTAPFSVRLSSPSTRSSSGGSTSPLAHGGGDVLHAAASGSRSVDGGVVRTAPGVGNLERVDAGHADGLPHRDVAAATCDGAAAERGRGREAGVLMVARQGVARVVRWTRRPTCRPFRRRGRRRTASAPAPLMVSPENTNCMGRMTTLGIYLISLVADPIRGNHRLDLNITSSPTLISRTPDVKWLNNRHLSHDDPTVWVTDPDGRQSLSDPATYYFC